MDEMRITDAEREAAADRVRAGFAEGRLDEIELEDRLSTIYGAKTGGELEPAFRGLPIPAGPPPEPSPLLSPTLISALSPFVLACVVCTIIWAITNRGYFWPQWVYLGCGIVIAFILVGANQKRNG